MAGADVKSAIIFSIKDAKEMKRNVSSKKKKKKKRN